MLELANHILLIGSSVTGSHLIDLIVLLVQHILTILVVVHIMTVIGEVVLVGIPLHEVILGHVDWSHRMAALIQYDALLLIF